MKQIVNYINERLHITGNSFYTCQPKTKKELQKIIIQRIKEDGHKCDLNDIDVSKITDMQSLFDASYYEVFKKFNGDISMWNVSNVKNMKEMFYECHNFNCDLSQWNVSNVENMYWMFYGCKKFNCDISKWDVSNVEYTISMFHECKEFNCDLSKWDMSNIEDMRWMFEGCKSFKQNLDKWNVPTNANIYYHAFKDCPTKPKWYKE